MFKISAIWSDVLSIVLKLLYVKRDNDVIKSRLTIIYLSFPFQQRQLIYCKHSTRLVIFPILCCNQDWLLLGWIWFDVYLYETYNVKCVFITWENKKMWLVQNRRTTMSYWFSTCNHIYIPLVRTLYCASTQDNLNKGCVVPHKDQWNLLERNKSNHEKIN